MGRNSHPRHLRGSTPKGLQGQHWQCDTTPLYVLPRKQAHYELNTLIVRCLDFGDNHVEKNFASEPLKCGSKNHNGVIDMTSFSALEGQGVPSSLPAILLFFFLPHGLT